MSERARPGPAAGRKLVVLGGCGFVGGNVARLACALGHSVVISGRRLPMGKREVGEGVSFRTLDITNRDDVLSALEEERPGAAVNAAAVAGVDFAEKNKELAWRVNVLGARNVAEGCALVGARCVFFSSDAVFAGTARSYREEDEPDPVNFYGKTKAEAEKEVLSADGNSVVVRISLVLGYPAWYSTECGGSDAAAGPVPGGNALYPILENSLKKGMPVPQPGDEIRTPVDVITLAEAALELAKSEFRGILHIGSTGSASRCEIARLAARAMGYPDGLISAAPAVSSQGRAPRHKNGVLSVDRAGRVLKTRMIGVEESVRRSVSERF